MASFLLLRLDAPLQAWGGVAMDTRRPTRAYPSQSALAGLFASAMGWRYQDGDRTTRLQDSLLYAVREDRAPRRIMDFQTADLTRETSGWTRWGVETRGGASIGTHILEKEYLAGASFAVAATLESGGPATLDDLASALEAPARPLFLGRKSCPPAAPLLEGRCEAATGFDALLQASLPSPHDSGPLRCWYSPGDGPEASEFVRRTEVWDRRDFATDRFMGHRGVVEGRVHLDDLRKKP